MSTLSFTVPGKVVSNNRVTRRAGNRSIKSPEATTYQARVAQYAWVACQEAKWVMPEACGVVIVAVNVRLDVDNIAKCVLDGMAASVYDDDKRVVRLMVQKTRDGYEERIIVVVSEAPSLPDAKAVVKMRREARKENA